MPSVWDSLRKYLEADGAEFLWDLLRKDEPLCLHTTMKVGGPAEFFAEPEDEESAVRLFAAAKKADIPCFLLGAGSNLIVSDEGIDGLVLSLRKLLGAPVLYEVGEEVHVGCSSGWMLADLAEWCAKNALSGLEFASGIPGTVGGAVLMNAGAYGPQISDVLKSVRSFHREYGIRERELSSLGYGYRDSVFLREPGEMILAATFVLHKGTENAIRESMDELNRKRRESQPLEWPSAGSMFKRPEGYFAGTLIQDTGLKGLSVGGAQVSPKHAGFIVNSGGATAADIKNLVRKVQEAVREKHGVYLEPEPRFVGRSSVDTWDGGD